jgi:hypothetical protein
MYCAFIKIKSYKLSSILLGILFSQSLSSAPLSAPEDTIADQVRGLYVSGWSIGEPKVLKHFIKLANRTEINSYILDVKEDDGYLSYPSKVKMVQELKTSIKKFNPTPTLRALHKNNIRVIARIVCFKDPVLPLKRPDLALKNKNGGIWKDKDGVAWLNPYNKDTWVYLVDIAKEAVQLGFDEIQFDYVRFTYNGDMSTVDFGDTKLQKYEAINGFLAYAREQLPKTIISADIFGIICESPADTEGIGQYLELIGKDIDYISPMVYPSHYSKGTSVNGQIFQKPDLDPSGIVYNAIARANSRISKVTNFRAKFRPYLQNFTFDELGEGNYQVYGAAQVRQQIDAVYKAGYRGWIFWNINNDYSEAAFLPKKTKPSGLTLK